VGIYRELMKEGESADGEIVRVKRRDGRATVTLNQPERLNALSAAS
jgi:enoyl-CoA hydratase/carnithine racemase